MSRNNWVWMPHAGHFICGSKCQFHLNTYVNGYIVSTVGELWPERASREIHAEIYDPEWYRENNKLRGDYFDNAYMKRFGFENIGCDRKYETMVFKAKRSEYGCCPYIIASGGELAFRGYNKPEDAYEGHRDMCVRYDKEAGHDQQ